MFDPQKAREVLTKLRQVGTVRVVLREDDPKEKRRLRSKISSLDWAKRNREKLNAYNRAYYHAHPERHQYLMEKQRARRAKIRAATRGLQSAGE